MNRWLILKKIYEKAMHTGHSLEHLGIEINKENISWEEEDQARCF